MKPIQNSGILKLSLSWYVQTYSTYILMHIMTLLRKIQAYSGIFSTLFNLAYSQPCHLLRPGIFRIRIIFKTETLTEHIQNPASIRTVYSGIIQSYSDIFRTLYNCHKCRNLAYSRLWNIQNPFIIPS